MGEITKRFDCNCAQRHHVLTFFRSQEAEIAAPNGQDDGRVVKSTGQEWIRYTSGLATTGGQTMER